VTNEILKHGLRNVYSDWLEIHLLAWIEVCRSEGGNIDYLSDCQLLRKNSAVCS